jgi:1-acyl-sn-glycerol-3-phosphate acyltransferase
MWSSRKPGIRQNEFLWPGLYLITFSPDALQLRRMNIERAIGSLFLPVCGKNWSYFMTGAVISTQTKKYRFSTFLGRTFLKAVGWTLDDRLPKDPKMVVVYAPHTSNWDFLYMLMAAYALGLHPNWMGKKELFWGPLGWLFRNLGGISVDRKKKTNVVEQTAQVFRERQSIILGIAPEATRSKAHYWRSGFYHIARQAGVSVHFAYLDYPNKTAGIAPGFVPSGDMDADMEIIREFFQDKIGKYPDGMGEIRFKPAE